MAKKTESRCCTCGAIVGPGVRFCCHFCKLTSKNDKSLPKKVNKHKSNKAKNKSKRKKKK